MPETIKKTAAAESRPAQGKHTASRGQRKAVVSETADGGKKARKRSTDAPGMKPKTKAAASADAKPKQQAAETPKRKADMPTGEKTGKHTAAAKPKQQTAADKPKRQSSAVKARKPASTSPKGTGGKKTRATSAAQATALNGAQGTRKRRADRRKSDVFLEQGEKPKKKKTGGRPPRRVNTLAGALNACLLICIAVLAALGIRQQGAYAEFMRMREVVDQQTFYEGTTVEGVDVSRMTLSNAIDYWRDRVEPRYAQRTVALDNGATVTAAQLGYTSDYEAVLSAAWSAGRSGSLEQRYLMASQRRENPVAYSVSRVDYSEALVEQYAQGVAAQIDQAPVDADIESFNAETFEFEFAPSREGRKLDTDALTRDIEGALSAGGGNVALQVSAVPPAVTTEDVSSQYGLIDYAITNANSSSRARINNIKLAMSFLNGVRVAPGETFSFNDTVGERTVDRGFRKATAYSGGDVTEQVGGGICQVSTTLFNAAVKADMEIVERHNHSLTVSYVDKGKDATVNWGNQDFRFKNTSEDDVFICCYLTDDNRVRFGIFGRLLPNGEKITVETVTTEVDKYDTEYQPSPLLAHGETYLLEKGRNGYKAEAYKVRWDANGNQLSKELLCKSIYKKKNEIIQYGA